MQTQVRVVRVVARRFVRALAVLLPVALIVLAPEVASADAPTSWNAGAPMSGLQVLLVFGGITLAIVVVVTIFALATVGKDDPRYLPDGSWGYPSQWREGRVLEAGHHETPEDPFVLDRGPH